jgi:hypothetical protein
MKYKQALEIIEHWLEKKKIREHCQTVCKGKCCFNICGIRRCARPPLPCAIFLCDDLRRELFGFHNGEEFQRRYIAVTSIVFGADNWDLYDMGKVSEDIDVDIPQKMIDDIVSMGYVPDDHGWSGCIVEKNGNGQ